MTSGPIVFCLSDGSNCTKSFAFEEKFWNWIWITENFTEFLVDVHNGMKNYWQNIFLHRYAIPGKFRSEISQRNIHYGVGGVFPIGHWIQCRREYFRGSKGCPEGDSQRDHPRHYHHIAYLLDCCDFEFSDGNAGCVWKGFRSAQGDPVGLCEEFFLRIRVDELLPGTQDRFKLFILKIN